MSCYAHIVNLDRSKPPSCMRELIGAPEKRTVSSGPEHSRWSPFRVCQEDDNLLSHVPRSITARGIDYISGSMFCAARNQHGDDDRW
jgi:hypothetical protein